MVCATFTICRILLLILLIVNFFTKIEGFSNVVPISISSPASPYNTRHSSTFNVKTRTTTTQQRLSPMEFSFAITSLSTQLSTLLPLLYTPQVNTLKPASGHTQPLFGPIDPYLAAGAKSIAPTVQALKEMGIEKKSDIIVPEFVKELSNNNNGNGIKILDISTIKPISILPGFAPTRGILPMGSTSATGRFIGPTATTNPDISGTIFAQDTSPTVFTTQIAWSSKFINVIDKLPEAAFVYALIEFLILRPSIDKYKEDIEEEPGRALADFIAVSAIRVTMFCIVAVVTTGIFY